MVVVLMVIVIKSSWSSLLRGKRVLVDPEAERETRQKTNTISAFRLSPPAKWILFFIFWKIIKREEKNGRGLVP